MKSKIVLMLLLLGLSTLLLSGCYTQLKTTRDSDDYENDEYVSNQQDDNQDNTAEQREEDSSYDNQDPALANNYYGNDDGWHSNLGFSYYYPSSYWPSTAFSTAWNNPWMYDRYWSNSYYPSYSYSPWYCGTPYVSYPYYGYQNWGYPYYYTNYAKYPANRYTWGPRTNGSERGRVTNDGNRRTEYSPYPSGTTAVAPGSGSSVRSNNGGTRTESYRPATRTARTQGTRRGASVDRGRSSGEGSTRGTRAPSYTPTYRSKSEGSSSESVRSGSSSAPSYTPPASSSNASPRSTNSAPRESSRPAPSSSSGGSSRGRKP